MRGTSAHNASSNRCFAVTSGEPKWTNKKAHHNRSQRRIEPKPPSNEGMAVTIYNVTLRDREIKPSSVTITVHGRRRGTPMNGFELVLK